MAPQSDLQLTLQRVAHTNNATLGILTLAQGRVRLYRCFTIEDERRVQKRRDETRIPAGQYALRLRTHGGFHTRYAQSAHIKEHYGMLELCDVPQFRDILIHTGNLETQTSGCILVNAMAGFTPTYELRGVASYRAYNRLYPPVAHALNQKQTVAILIRNETTIRL